MKLRIALFCLLGGLSFTIPAFGVGHFGWWWLSGILTAAVWIPVARYGPRGAWAQFGSLFCLLVVVGMGCTFSEGAIFFPEMKPVLIKGLPGATVLYLIAAAVLTGLARMLKLNQPESQEAAHRPAAAAVAMILLSSASYVLYYLIFGTLVFQFFTRQYYPHAVEQVAAMGLWFWAYQFARGLLMTLAVVPVIRTLRLPRLQTALIAGLLVWVVGGAAPLIVPSDHMVAAQRYLHIVEIFTQNFSLGVTAALLLRSRAARLHSTAQSAPQPV